MRTKFTIPAVAALALAAVVPTFSQAHVTLEVQQAAAGSTYKAVLRVPHGCAGAPTNTVRVKIPDGATGVKPQPKPGWQLSTVKGKLAKPIPDGHGGTITEGVVEIAWSGGNLPDDNYDEFVFRMGLPKTPDVTLYVPVVQECPQGAAERWIEIPAAGQKADDLKSPAPQLKLTAPAGGH